MNNSNPFFTLFTPVYNGADTIHRVFESVRKQSFKSFEWIIINDGSTDNTSEIVKKLIPTLPSFISVTYIEHQNTGKHASWNKAVNIGIGNFFVPADADDSFEANSLSFFYEKISSFSEYELQELSGINVLCYDNDTNNIVGDYFPEDAFKTNNFELAYRNKVSGEKWGCIKLTLLKENLFPQIKHSYFPEAYLWFTLAKLKYAVVCYNTPLRRYYTNTKGLSAENVAHRSFSERIVNVKFYKWLLVNFGFKILLYTPVIFFRHIMRLILDIFFIGKETLKNKSVIFKSLK